MFHLDIGVKNSCAIGEGIKTLSNASMIHLDIGAQNICDVCAVTINLTLPLGSNSHGL